jgi:hypothetical protein
MKNRRCKLCYILQRPLLHRHLQHQGPLIADHLSMDAAPNLDIFTGAETDELLTLICVVLSGMATPMSDPNRRELWQCNGRWE